MPHKFATYKIPEGETSIEQSCLTCGVPSIVYRSGRRFYPNASGKITTNIPKCKNVHAIHSFPKVEIPEGRNEIIQTCVNCGKQRVVYASGSRCYFDEATGSRISFPTACAPINAKVVSISEFVKANQVDAPDVGLRQKFFEAIFILSSIQRFGITERTTMMRDSFLEGLQDELVILSKAL